MTVTIYDYKNNPRTIRITKPVAEISVEVISGDEIIEFTYSDGTKEEFDSCTGHRFANFYDGAYMLSDPVSIQKWIDYVPSENVKERIGTAAYERLNLFADIDEEI